MHLFSLYSFYTVFDQVNHYITEFTGFNECPPISIDYPLADFIHSVVTDDFVLNYDATSVFNHLQKLGDVDREETEYTYVVLSRFIFSYNVKITIKSVNFVNLFVADNERFCCYLFSPILDYINE